jgi:hypothetical protein
MASVASAGSCKPAGGPFARTTGSAAERARWMQGLPSPSVDIWHGHRCRVRLKVADDQDNEIGRAHLDAAIALLAQRYPVGHHPKWGSTTGHRAQRSCSPRMALIWSRSPPTQSPLDAAVANPNLWAPATQPSATAFGSVRDRTEARQPNGVAMARMSARSSPTRRRQHRSRSANWMMDSWRSQNHAGPADRRTGGHHTEGRTNNAE